MFWFLHDAKDKKESGENPERTGHCNRSAVLHLTPLVNNWEGKKESETS